MARTYPFARKPSRPNQTVLAVGEGDTDVAFLKYLKSLYVRRECGISVKVENAHGGGPESIIRSAVKLTPRNYDRAFVLLDKIPTCSATSIRKARQSHLDLIWSIPCVEGLYLAILEREWNPAGHTSAECKTRFEDNYLNEREKMIPEQYGRFFSYELLENLRLSIPELNKIILILTNK